MKVCSASRDFLFHALLTAVVFANVANAGTPGACTGHIPKCKPAKICGSPSVPCSVWVSEGQSKAYATAQNLAGGHVGGHNKPICVNPGTTISWSTQEADSDFIATFGVPHPFSTTPPATAAIFSGHVGATANGIASTEGCYQYNLQHSIHGAAKYADPKVIVTSVRFHHFKSKSEVGSGEK